MKKELEELKRAQQQKGGVEFEARRELEEQLERERAARVEQVSTQALHRIMKRDLALGWGAWHGGWAERRRVTRMLQQSANRLTRPALMKSIRHWKNDWEASQAELKSMSFAQQLEAQKEETKAAIREVAAMREELERARKAMREGRGAEEEQKRLMEERIQAEKEKRIEHTKEMALRRIAKRELALGWESWATPYFERKYMLSKLRQASMIMLKGNLAKCFQSWQRKAFAMKARTASMSIEEKLTLVGREKEELRAQLQEMERELTDMRNLDEIAL